MKIYFETYGCTSNKADTRALEALAENEGHKITDNLDKADLVVLNTCIVIKKTENRMIKRIKELNDNSLVVAGCLAEIKENEIKEINKDIDVVPPNELSSFLEVIGNKEKKLPKWEIPVNKDGVLGQLQISEGCVGNCSYCITKFARGNLKTFPLNNLVEKAESLINDGVKELQLTAQDTATYGLRTKNNLYDLLKDINEIEGDFRVRIGMMNPQNVINRVSEIINVYKLEKVYNFLHLPVQSGSNSVLDKMNRNYDVSEFKEIVRKFKEEIGGVLSTDIIVGFPGETRKDFEKTVSLIKDIEPDVLNITRFSPRPGTKADDFDEVKSKIKKERSKRLTELKKVIARDQKEKEVGSIKNVLVTKDGKKDTMIGKDMDYNTVVIEDDVEIGEFVDVEIMDFSFAYLIGEVI